MSTGPVERRLRALATEHGVAAEAIRPWRRLLALVSSDPTAPTTVVDPLRGADAHVADSLTGLTVPAVREAGLLADLGAGAGFPGLVLAAAVPQARVALVESSSRKCAFLERAVEAMELANAEVVCARAEEWAAGMGACDVVTARAVAALDVLVEYAAPLLVEGGMLVAWKGRRDAAEEGAGRRAAELVGLVALDPVETAPARGADHRTLDLYSKGGPTPDRYPRRPGMARKRPLGGSTRA